MEDADRLGRRARRADDGTAPWRGHGHTPHPAAIGRGCEPRARADRSLHRRQRRDRSRVRARVRLWPRSRRVDAEPGSASSRRQGRRSGTTAPDRHARWASRPAGLGPATSCAPARPVYCALAWSDEALVPTSGDEAADQLAATTRFWRDWLARAAIPDHELGPMIQRSALAIKGLTYMPTGAAVAALTTSLPETPGGERNWDYRYSWIRDSTFLLRALHFLLLDWEADEFMQFMADLDRNDDGGLQIMYGIDGRRGSDRVGARGPIRLRRRIPRPHRQRRLRPAAERRLRCRPRLRPAPQPPEPAHSAAPVAARAGAGRVRDSGVASTGPGHLGGARRAAAVRLVEADVLGRARPRGASREHPRRSCALGQLGRDCRGDQVGHPRARGRQSRRAAPALRDRRARRLHAARGDLRVPAAATTHDCVPPCWPSKTS